MAGIQAMFSCPVMYTALPYDLQDPRSAYAHLLYLGYGGPDGSGGAALLSKGVRRRAKHKPEMAARCVP
jgi:hypothetical protein